MGALRSGRLLVRARAGGRGGGGLRCEVRAICRLSPPDDADLSEREALFDDASRVEDAQGTRP